MKWIVASVCATVVILLCLHKLKQVVRYREKTQIINATIFSISLIMWPLIWYKVLGSISQESISWISLIWPVFIIGFDFSLLDGDAGYSQSKRQLLSMDSNTVCSLTFAMAGILASKNLESSKKCCNDLFMYALIGCVIFVLPVSHASPNCIETVAFESLQRMSLVFSTAFLIAGTLFMNSDKIQNIKV